MGRRAAGLVPPTRSTPPKKFGRVSGYAVCHHGYRLHQLRPACRKKKRVPLLAMAAMCGVSRLAFYGVLWSSRAKPPWRLHPNKCGETLDF
jgi:hypothetical protein